MARLQYLVIHCTATPEGREVSSDEIRAWHTNPKPKGNGWRQVGYTDMIHLNGEIERLVENNEDSIVDPWEITNGARGYNAVSRHIVYVGGLTKDCKNSKDTRTEVQRKALQEYVRTFKDLNPGVKIIGHNELSNKACPGFDVQAWLKQV